MTKNSAWTILAVIGAIVIAWFLVNVLFSLVAFVVKLILVAIVAVIVYVVMRVFVGGRDDRR
ncbi:hypothetical protein [Microbacterium caowuchunii]|uniref:Flagellar biosynthesis protein FlhA n=1 Tax=Microbacterium caowuchunii TaxID=2614638 RepID=A0A5N0TKF9_9MICO|nr:hypothetical protein [Microbacterium caowuchunii]KAA9133829.1 hypothetical protein F6B40_08755 [Microbacterium caowuchunii]